ncbi:MAG: CHRD domain-containing protein [Acidobacteria bacterium]|nr:CHRD domain-containing protein [Acidobacteriota bacterium]
MNNLCIGRWLSVPLLLALAALSGSAQNSRRVVNAELTAFQEVPSISSTGEGKFRARLDDASIQFELVYSGLEGAVQQAHIHIGQLSVNGGITIWLCSNLASPPTPAGIPACPQEGTVTGVRMMSDVVGPSGQGVAAGEFEEVLRAIRSGNTYANVHTVKHPGGEIRGQIKPNN